MGCIRLCLLAQLPGVPSLSPCFAYRSRISLDIPDNLTILLFADVSVLPFARRLISLATVNQLGSQSLYYKARECDPFKMECGYGKPVIPALLSFSLFALTREQFQARGT